MKHVSCYAPYGEGGLGRYLEVIVEEARRTGDLAAYYGSRIKPGDVLGHRVEPRMVRWLLRTPPFRFDVGWKDYIGGHLFDRAVAQRLVPCNTFHGFNGKALYSFRAARSLGAEKLILESANSHVSNVKAQHVAARTLCPIENTWLNSAQHDKALREYAMADVIYVASSYSRQTFMERGVPESKLRFRALTVSPRYQAFEPSEQTRPGFHILFVGRVDITKGLHLLYEAFRRLDVPGARLSLVGGTSSRGMRRFMDRWLKEDSRVRLGAGDPLPLLGDVDCLVHPSYEDGFALAPMEALYCGIPVIVSADTGMKDYVVEGQNGFVIPTGAWEPILETLQRIARNPLRGKFPKPEHASGF